MRHNLKSTGLSLSQATSISNLCYQRAHEINNILTGINNATRTFKIAGEQYTETVGKSVPTNIKEVLEEKSNLHAVQAFLVHNIKMKDQLLKELKNKPFKTDLECPETPEFKNVELTPQIIEEWGWNQLTESEFAEYMEAEAHASHIGQFIHKGSPLDKLRTELPNIKSVDWISVKDGERVPVDIKPHHTSEDLLKTHEELATLHRSYEQRVNYFKAKVKNLITEESARISRENAVKTAEINKINEDLKNIYNLEYAKFSGAVKVEKEEFEAKRHDEIKATSALRIAIDSRFQVTIDMFLKGLTPDPEAEAK